MINLLSEHIKMEKVQTQVMVGKPGADFWKQQIKKWKTSGLSQAKFCLKHKLILSTFQYWKYKLNRENKPNSLLPVTIKPDIDKKSPSDSSGISVCIKQRFIVQLEKRFCEDTLSRLIDVLEAQ